MARSENQGLQIAVIIFAFLTIALSVATFYFFNDASTQYANALEKEQKTKEMDAGLRKALEEQKSLLDIIGLDGQSTVKIAQDQRDAAIARFSGLPTVQNSKSLLPVLSGLGTTMDQWNQERQDQKKKAEDLEKQLRALEARYAADVKKAQDTYAAEIQRLTGEVAALTTKDAAHVTQLQGVTDELQKKREELTKAIDDLNRAKAAHDKEVAAVREEMRKVMLKQYQLENNVFERPDAMIVSVNVKDRSVTINVGRADFLRQNIHFSVYKAGETNVHNRTKKGSIAVTKFIGDNLAEARIVESVLKDPMLTGDVIFTPTWTPGTQETFVLAGDFDVNGDRTPDNDQMKILVELNGGKLMDEVNTDTRYVLLGDPPLAADQKSREAYKKLGDLAKQYGVKTMGLQEFIEYTGSREMFNQLRRVGGKTDTEEVLKGGARAVNQGRSSFRAPEQAAGGLRRFEPGGNASPSGTAGAADASKKVPPRRPGPGAQP